MLRQRTIVAGLSLLALAALETRVLADGETSAAPSASPASTSRWSGFYLGIGGGAGSVDQTIDGDVYKSKTIEKRHKYSDGPWQPWKSYELINEQASYGSDEWHGFGTLQIGADHLISDRFLIGAFADIDFYRNADTSFSESSKWLSASGRLDLERVWSVGGRLGVLARPDFLLYAVGGYTQAHIDGASEVDFKWGPTLSGEAPDKLRGYFVGGGGEWLIHDNLSLKLEYRYAKYRDEGISGSASDTYQWADCYKEYQVTKNYAAGADFDTDIQSIRGALVFRIGRDEPAPAPLK